MLVGALIGMLILLGLPGTGLATLAVLARMATCLRNLPRIFKSATVVLLNNTRMNFVTTRLAWEKCGDAIGLVIVAAFGNANNVARTMNLKSILGVAIRPMSN